MDFTFLLFSFAEKVINSREVHADSGAADI